MTHERVTLARHTKRIFQFTADGENWRNIERQVHGKRRIAARAAERIDLTPDPSPSGRGENALTLGFSPEGRGENALTLDFSPEERGGNILILSPLSLWEGGRGWGGKHAHHRIVRANMNVAIVHQKRVGEIRQTFARVVVRVRN